MRPLRRQNEGFGPNSDTHPLGDLEGPEIDPFWAILGVISGVQTPDLGLQID